MRRLLKSKLLLLSLILACSLCYAGVDFNGDADSIDTTGIDLTISEITVSFWFNPGAVFNSATVVSQSLIGKYEHGASHWIFALQGTDSSRGNDGGLYFKGEAGGAGYAESTTVEWLPGNLYHIVGKYKSQDGDDQRLYVNGVIESDVSAVTENRPQVMIISG